MLIAFGSIMDLFHDGRDGLSREHILMEFFTFILSTFAAIFFIVNAIRMKNENQDLLSTVRTESKEKKIYKDKVLKYSKGLSSAIEEEFSRWGLTKTEKATGLLLLKGLSTKEIAEIQGSQDKTIRHHCSAIYKKSGLSGRSELSAYFLEDLLVNVSQEQAD